MVHGRGIDGRLGRCDGAPDVFAIMGAMEAVAQRNAEVGLMPGDVGVRWPAGHRLPCGVYGRVHVQLLAVSAEPYRKDAAQAGEERSALREIERGDGDRLTE